MTGAYAFLISLYLATVASFLVVGISLLGSVSPLGTGLRGAVAFVVFTLLGLLAKSLLGNEAASGEAKGQHVDFTLPPTAHQTVEARPTAARSERGRQSR